MNGKNKNQQKILIVDDEEITRELIRACLEKEHYHIAIAANGKQAVQCLAKERFDLMIIDIRMDDIDGIALCKLINNKMASPPPALMMTALDCEKSVEKSFAAGAADYIRKPIDWGILKNKIKYIIHTDCHTKQRNSLISEYETIFNATANGLCAVDQNQKITFINAVALDMIGLNAKECIGRPCREIISLQDPKNQDKSIDFFPLCNDSSKTTTGTHHLGSFKIEKCCGSIVVDCTITCLFNKDTFAGGVLLLQDITDKEEALEKHRKEANHDALTKLPNRKFLTEKLPQAISLADRNNRILALLFVDLDSFKPINDNFGHKVGDMVLQKIAERFLKLLRTSDTVCRIGGDEFVIILESTFSIQGVKDVAEKIILQLNEPILIDENVCQLGGSIGISLYPYDSNDADTMLNHGDIAMYNAKNGGKNRYEFYETNQQSVLPKWHKQKPKSVSDPIAKLFPRKLTCITR